MVDLSKFIEVKLNEQDDFLKVRETLTRIGVSSRKERVLYQSCHILHKQGRYYLVHFKEMFALDGKPSNLSENDIQRRNAISKLLEEWGLIEILNPQLMIDNIAPIHQIKIISFKEKDEWELVSKYSMGKKKFEQRDFIMKIVKLKNIYTGEIILCRDLKDTTEGDGKVFVKVFKEENPQRTFLVNREAFTVLDK